MATERRRRFWSDDEKRRIVAQTLVPSVSVSQVARRYDVNANLVFKWLRDPRFKPSGKDAAAFLPVEVAPAELLRGGGAIAAGVVCEDSRIEIELENGRRLRLSGAVDPNLVVRLVRELSS